MKPLYLSSIASLCLMLTACSSTKDVYVVYPDWTHGKPIKIVACADTVNVKNSNLEFGGIEVPVPALGGGVKVGSITYKEDTLNNLYRSVCGIYALRHGYCQERADAAQISREEYAACLHRMEQQDGKLTYFALAAQQGEAALEEAVHKYGVNSPAATAETPAKASTKAADQKAVTAAKKDATTTTAENAKALPPKVAKAVAPISTKTLLKVARQPVQL